MWGVIDAVIYQLTLGRAMDVLAEMRSNHVAANAWMLAPGSAMKALAIFGSFRTAAAGLAGAFVFTVFRFSGNVFTSFTSGALGVQGQGTAAAPPIMTHEGRAQIGRASCGEGVCQSVMISVVADALKKKQYQKTT